MSHINTPGVLAEIVQRTGVDMKREQSRAWMLMAALVLLAALIGGKEFWRAFRYESRQVLQEYTEKMYMPGVAYQRADETRSSKDWFREKALSWLPLVKYVSDRENLEQEVEDEETLAMKALWMQMGIWWERARLRKCRQIWGRANLPSICRLKDCGTLTIF